MSKVKKEYEEALKDVDSLVESTAQLIDMPFAEFSQYLEGKNVGTLRAYRALLQSNLDQADAYAKKLVDNTVTTLGKNDRLRLGSIFGVVSKIIERMGYIDLLLSKNSIK